ncbi:MAG: alpha-N-arabinofuranosidase, partial [Terracidiphilus sp.]
MMKASAALATITALTFSLPLFAQKPSFTIEANHPIAQVSPMFYGLMTEEINHAFDGGLYGELIRDRTPSTAWDALLYWPMVARGNSAVDVSIDKTTGPSDALPRSYRVTVSAADPNSSAGMENGGYWGIPVRPNTVYSGSFYAKCDSPGVPVTVTLQNDQTGAVAATGTVTGLTNEWKQFT